MAFETAAFVAFFGIVVATYWIARTIERQNLLLVAANYVFCGWIDARFALALWLFTVIAFGGGLWVARVSAPSARRLRLVTCVTTLLSALLVFKYGGAMAAAFGLGSGVLGGAGAAATWFAPLGVSYYALQTIGYCVDVYRGRAPERDPLAFFAYVGFFPCLVAGPIPQADRVLGQFTAQRRSSVEQIRAGLRQIAWGLYAKLVADALAPTVDYVFARHDQLAGSTLALGLAIYSLQLYADFSGYSNLAIGLGRLLGFSLPQNFDGPYFARNVFEFWRRWHMSLSAWLRAYLYLPLGGSRGGRLVHARNVLIVFGLSGLWHGVSWNFLVWGLLNGLYFLPLIFFGPPRGTSAPAGRAIVLRDLGGMAVTFGAISLSRVFFRSPDMPSALAYLTRLFDSSLFTVPDLDASMLAWAGLLLGVEWVRQVGTASRPAQTARAVLRYPAYATIAYFVVTTLARHESRDFLYARF